MPTNEGAAYTSPWGEISPAELTVDLYTKSDNTIVAVRAQNSVMDYSKLTHLASQGIKLTTDFAPIVSPPLARVQAQRARLDPDVHSSLAMAPHSFTMLDVGRWGGPAPMSSTAQRDFGIAWMRYIALCSFVQQDPQYDTDQHLLLDGAGVPHQIPVNQVIRQLRGNGYSVRLNKWLISRGSINGKRWTDDGRVYVILPDLHLPVATKKPLALPPASQPASHVMRGMADPSPLDFTKDKYELLQSDGPHLERHQYRNATEWFDNQGKLTGRSAPDDEGMIAYQNGARALGAAADRWFDRYIGGDIFGPQTNPAARDLEVFLDRVISIKLDSAWPLHFVQVGDMYDLWIGLECYFEDIPVDKIGWRVPDSDIVLTPPSATATNARAFVDAWVKRTEACFPTLIPKFNRMGATPGFNSWWLWGNHDCYLAAHTPPGIPKRTREIRTGGVYIEHGQRADPDNRDGARSGHTTTNKVFRNPPIRIADPNRRHYYTSAAAIAYAVAPNFGTYVMGHTHSAFLTHVMVHVHKDVPPPASQASIEGPAYVAAV